MVPGCQSVSAQESDDASRRSLFAVSRRGAELQTRQKTESKEKFFRRLSRNRFASEGRGQPGRRCGLAPGLSELCPASQTCYGEANCRRDVARSTVVTPQSAGARTLGIRSEPPPCSVPQCPCVFSGGEPGRAAPEKRRDRRAKRPCENRTRFHLSPCVCPPTALLH